MAAAEVRPELRALRFSTVAPGSERVVLQLNGSYSPKVFTMKGETPRIVLDFADMTHSGKVSPLTVVNGALVQRIRVGMHPGDAPKTRVVLDLATFAGVSFDQRFDPAASTLTIELTGKGKGATPGDPHRDRPQRTGPGEQDASRRQDHATSQGGRSRADRGGSESRQTRRTTRRHGQDGRHHHRQRPGERRAGSDTKRGRGQTG